MSEKPETAFEQQQASGEVPEWARWKAARLIEAEREHTSEHVELRAFARYIAAHEPAPVDPLRRVLDEAGDECGFHISEDFVEACRARGVTVAKGVGE